LYWLAIGREAVSISQLLADFIPSGLRSQVLGALQSLDRQSTIEKSGGLFTLQPVVMEYVTAKFIDLVSEEITTLDVAIFNSHTLIQAQTRDYIRESQVRMILAPLVERLMGKLRSKLEIKHQLVGVACLQDNRLLIKLRSEFTDTCGYAGGNLINLYHHLAIDLSGYDFSGLCIWQADLLNVDLHDINFANTDVAKSVFTETFGTIHSLAFSNDGSCLACGDFNGDIRYLANSPVLVAGGYFDRLMRLWQIDTGKFTSFKGHTDAIRAIAVSPDGRFLAGGSFDRTIRLWDLHTGQCLQVLEGHESGVFAVAFIPHGTNSPNR
jgi:hypothetical protein